VPTYEVLPGFLRDLKGLTREQRAAFIEAVAAFVEDLQRGQGFRKGLRVKKMHGHEDVWEMTWAPDGRATWQYGPEQRPGEAHAVWRRVGTHGIFNRP
jgi:hypothetical protein